MREKIIRGVVAVLIAVGLWIVSTLEARAQEPRVAPLDCEYLHPDVVGSVVMVCGVREPSSTEEQLLDVIERLKEDVGECLDALGLENDRSRLDGYQLRWANEIVRLPTRPTLYLGFDDAYRRVIYVRSWIPLPWTVNRVLQHEAVHVLMNEGHNMGHEHAYKICAPEG